MLNEEVINAVKEGKFTVFGVDTIDEGMEVLTGLKAGTLNEDGEYEVGTVNYLVQEKLYYYYNLSKEFEEEKEGMA